MEDLYRILQVDPGADPEVIEVAWRRLARLYHPEGERPDPERMVAINVAHDILKDPVKRAEYDRQRAATRGTAGEQAGPGLRPPRDPAGGAHGSGHAPWNPPGVSCWRHPGSPAVGRCAGCRAFLCAGCATHWPATLCDACVRREGVRRQLQIIWPATAVAAWIAVAALELDALLSFHLGDRLAGRCGGARVLPRTPAWSASRTSDGSRSLDSRDPQRVRSAPCPGSAC